MEPSEESSGTWRVRILGWLLLPLACGAVLLPGLGANGLWDPWEMQSAHVARTLSGPARVLVLEAPQGSVPRNSLAEVLPVSHAVDALLEGRGDVWDANRFVETPLLRGHSQGRARVLKEGRKALQDTLFHALVVDAHLWMKDAGDQAGAARLVADVAQFSDTHAGMRTVLLPGALEAEWDTFQETLRAGEEEQNLLLPSTAQWLRTPPTSANLQEVLAGVESDVWWRAQFLREGTVRSVPLLPNWLVAASGSLFGFSEFSQRLPGLLIALLGLALVMGVGRTFFSTRTAVLACLVLVTTPLFFTSARVVGGELLHGVLLFASMGVCGMWWSGRWRHGVSLAAFVLTGILLFFSDGLHALLGLTLLVGVYAFVQQDMRRVVWTAVGASGLLLVLGVVLVFVPDEWTVFHHFRFMQRLHSAGPGADLRSFEHFIRQVGFGFLPWSALLPFALGGLIRFKTRQEEEGTRGSWNSESFTMLLFLGILVPFVLHMVTLRDFSHLVLPIAPAIALAVALLLAEWSHREVFPGAPIAALIAFIPFALFLHDLKSSPSPLFEFVANDPPFERKDGAAVFPGGIRVGIWFLGAGALAMLAVVNHLGGLVRAGHLILRWLRIPLACASAALVVWIALIARWVTGMMLHFREAFSLTTASGLPESERLFTRDLMQRPEHVGLLVLLGLVVLRGLVVTTPLGRRWSEGLPSVVRNVIAGAGALLNWTGRGGVRIGVIALAASGLLVSAFMRGDMVGTGGQGLEAFLVSFGDPGTILGTCGVLAVVLRDRLRSVPLLGSFLERWPRGVEGVLLAALLLAAYVGVLMSRTLWVAPIEVWAAIGGLMVVGWPVVTTARDLRSLLASVLVLATAWGVAVLGPLLMHWSTLSPTLFPEGDEDAVFQVLVTSRLTLGLVALLVLLGINGFLDRFSRMRALGGLLSRGMLRMESGPATVGILVVCALGMAFVQTGSMASELSLHVSQKHILERWHESSVGSGAPAAIYKHGNFKSGAGAVNFYTVDVPEVSDSRHMLDLLARTRDGVARVRGADGRSRLHAFAGWNPANDRNEDGIRDWVAEQGMAEEVASGTLVDRDKSWETNQWARHLLIDSSGRAFPIESNTSDTLSFRGRPAFGGAESASSRYAIDDAAAVDHRATGTAKERVFFILSGANFSELNDKFRKRTGGRHIAVLDDRSSRFVLAASDLSPGEDNQNRIAKHVLTRDEFDALEGVEPRKVMFGESLVLVGVKVETPKVRRKAEFSLTLYYEVVKTPKTNWKIFMHIERPGTTNRIHGDHFVLNQSPNGSQKKCEGCFRARHWLPGDIIVDQYTGKVTSGTPSGTQEVWMGFFSKGTDKRLPVKSFEEPVKHDGSNRVSVARFTVR